MGDLRATRRRTPALVWLPIDDQQPCFLPSPRLSWWANGRGWFRYYAIQWRWRFERKVARLRGKRWGS